MNGEVDGLPWWTIVIFLPFLALIGAHLWAMFDAAAQPSARWRQAGYRKVLWLAVIWFTWPLGMTYYVWRIRPALVRSA